MNLPAKAFDFGVTEHKGIPVVNSRKVAEAFEREHKNVLQAIKNAVSETSSFAADFSAANFIQSKYKLKGRYYPEYLLTRDGFSFIVMGFTGEKAAKFKVAYINRFNEMEEHLQSLKIARMEFPQLTDAIKQSKEEPKPYHYSNEINMLNKIVLGMTAKKFRETHGIDKNQSIRPYLTAQQIAAIEKLQKFDIGLLHTEPDFHKRKEILTAYYERISSIRLIG